MPRALRLAALLLAVSCPIVAASAQEDISREGGDATTRIWGKGAYSQSAPSLDSATQLLLRDLGEAGFLRDFSKSKIGGEIRVGPKFNAPSCASCHLENGRGALHVSAQGGHSDTVVKVSEPGAQALPSHGPAAVQGVGLQVKDHALRGTSPDAQVSLRWELVSGAYGDGRPYQLRFPKIRLTSLTSAHLRTALKSLRRTPPVFGSGLLDAVPAKTIEALADPDDSNHDGISGRPNRVWSVERGRTELGRFGFKAGAPSLRQQIAAAYATDMGITNPLFRESGKRPDIPESSLSATVFYTRTLGVPQARSQVSPTVQRGRALFESLGCASCHATMLHTGPSPVAALAHQEIHPFSDLLLHDMGPGLADNRPEFVATGREWRTTPLWGIGLAETVLGIAPTYLHDGRARTLEEAILWHGGEASGSQQLFRQAPLTSRDDLIQFLRSL